MEEKPKTYIEGFNNGFRMKMYNPELFDKIKESLGQDDYGRGLEDGSIQAEKEKEKNRLQELENIREEKTPEQDIER